MTTSKKQKGLLEQLKQANKNKTKNNSIELSADDILELIKKKQGVQEYDEQS